jgi:hypothetical protein
MNGEDNWQRPQAAMPKTALQIPARMGEGPVLEGVPEAGSEDMVAIPLLAILQQGSVPRRPHVDHVPLVKAGRIARAYLLPKYKERPGMLAGMYLSATRMSSSWGWEFPTTET